MSKHSEQSESIPAEPCTPAATEILARLSDEYGDVTWTPSGEPVDELVGTILSQNTSDTNTDRAFAALKDRYPRWEDVRDAPTDEVANTIRAGGLADTKAPRIQRVLEEILVDGEPDQNQRFLEHLHSFELTEAMARLTALPGVGPKTAACVLLFAAGRPALPVDTHVFRVSRRLGLIEPTINADQAHEALRSQLTPEDAYQFHVHMIKHGRRICRARTPLCEQCVLNDVCQYYRENVVAREFV